MPAGKAKECRCFQSPSRYMQGPGLINRLPKFAATFGNTALLIIDPFFYDDFSVRVPKMCEDAGMKAYCVKFPGYAGHKELDELDVYKRQGMSMLADCINLDEEYLRRRRADSIANVKRTNGRLRFEQIVRDANGSDDEWQD